MNPAHRTIQLYTKPTQSMGDIRFVMDQLVLYSPGGVWRMLM